MIALIKYKDFLLMKKFKIATIVLSAVLCLSLCACSQGSKDNVPDSPSGSFASSEIETKDYGSFLIKYPKTWTVTKDSDIASIETNSIFYSVSSPTANGMTTNMSIAYSANAQGFSVENIMKNYDSASTMQALQEQLGSSVTLQSEAVYNFNGITGVEYVFATTFNSIKMQIVQVIFIADKKVYVLDVTIINSQEEQDALAIVNSLSAK